MGESSITPEWFPGILYELARAGHVEQAVSLSDARGGRTIDIPSLERLSESNALVRMVGIAAARVICERWGGTRQYVPLRGGVGSKMRNILAHPGGTAECARDLQTSEQWVRRVRNQGGLRRWRPGDGEASGPALSLTRG
ncbi:hypothetical protein [Inquilinus sp. OTU3971]|uniref:hypothetical protein n=1 Tax=Inquilinus sp. OTU3971 TaxID=3043855 RepID=UPI00313AE56C